jgi:hypothetical protein
VYFFLGSGCYPEGIAAFVLAPEALDAAELRFSPFDSGALAKPHVEHAAHPDFARELPLRRAFLEDHTGGGPALRGFAARYIAAHFRDAVAYVARPQESEPDFPAYHGLRSPSHDRREWTVEVRAPGAVAIDERSLVAMLVQETARLVRPQAWLRSRIKVVPASKGDFGDAVTTEILDIVRRSP